jgi:phenylalanyl-tRNA synthetase beta chain
VGRGYTEILTNSITNSAYFSEEVLSSSVKMLNNLSAELDVMRPSMLETGLESIAYNMNRKNTSISFFEIGKVYGKSKSGNYYENEQLAVYISGKSFEEGWRSKGVEQDFFVAKGIAQSIFELLGLKNVDFQNAAPGKVSLLWNKKNLGYLEVVGGKKLQAFGIKQPVVYIQWELAALLQSYQQQKVVYQEISKYPSIERDLALVLDQATSYDAIQSCIKEAKLSALKDTRVFDVFESEKLGHQKKSVAINFVFNGEDKTLTDSEIEKMMGKMISLFEKNIQAEIRK